MGWQLLHRRWAALMQRTNALRSRRERTPAHGMALPAHDMASVDSARLQAEQVNDWESEGGTLAPSADKERRSTPLRNDPRRVLR
jgi:hypothetical protein